MTFRRRQRSLQHQAAHDGEQVQYAPPLNHPLVPKGEPELISDRTTLAAFAAHIRQERTFAFDTELIGEVAYRPKTCLIQLATSKRVALVDPIALPDVSVVWELVSDQNLVTIVHAGASDLSPVRRHQKREPRNLMDVQVAAGFLGMAFPSSLAKLVERFAGHVLTKGHTFTDWDARPLSASQLHYAADDVRYLPLVWDVVRQELEARDRLMWAATETIARLDDPHLFDSKAQMRRASRGYDLNKPQEALLEALCVARDMIAQAEDLPHRTTIPDGSLLEIVRDRPETPAALDAIRGLPRPVVSRHSDLLLSTLRANQSERATWFGVRRRREDEPEIKVKITAMLAEAVKASEELQVAASLAVTRSDLERFLRNSLAASEHGEAPPSLFEARDWRREAFGDRIERAGDVAPTT
ncbi:MAG: HRDC domain-containing protein [Phycisphaerae bacterium]|nr:HRDC domain-containing protein [Phycisphaerae bacterium]